MMYESDWSKNLRMVARTCPNALKSRVTACNCIGLCQPIFTTKDDPRTDEEIIKAYRNKPEYRIPK